MTFIKKYKNFILSLLSYVCIPVVFFLESLYFTFEKVSTMSRIEYNNYLSYTGLPLIIVALIGIFFAFRGKRAGEPNWVSLLLIALGIIFCLIVILIMGASSAINGSEAA